MQILVNTYCVESIIFMNISFNPTAEVTAMGLSARPFDKLHREFMTDAFYSINDYGKQV